MDVFVSKRRKQARHVQWRISQRRLDNHIVYSYWTDQSQYTAKTHSVNSTQLTLFFSITHARSTRTIQTVLWTYLPAGSCQSNNYTHSSQLGKGSGKTNIQLVVQSHNYAALLSGELFLKSTLTTSWPSSTPAFCLFLHLSLFVQGWEAVLSSWSLSPLHDLFQQSASHYHSG